MDGTLVDTEPLWWQAVVEAAGRHGRTVSEVERPAIFGQAVEPTADYLDVGLAREALIADLEATFLELVRSDLVVLTGARDLLGMLKTEDIPAALVSASPRSVMDVVLAVLGTEWFVWSVAAGETSRTKPFPDPYLAAAEQLGVSPRDCVAIEDSATGIASATAAGMQVVLAPAAEPTAAWRQASSLDEVDLAFLTDVMRGA